MRALRIEAYAKVNLGLAVLARREDGFHDIETLFQSVSLCDVVRLAPREEGRGVGLNVSGLEVPAGPSNLAWRAAESLLTETASCPGVEIEIEKRIPVAAGLGGGSADAAAVLHGMNALFGLGIGAGRLRELGLELGSDVPFMLRGGTALGRGRGELLEDSEPVSEMALVLVTPDFGVTAAEAYGAARIGLTERPRLTKVSCSALREGDRGALERALRNDLEAGVILARPEVAEIKEDLLRCGAVAAALSGSGPTVYGVVRDRAEGDSVAALLPGPGRTVHVVEPIDIGHSAAWEEGGGGHTS